MLGGELRTGGGWLGGGLPLPGRAQAQTAVPPLLRQREPQHNRVAYLRESQHLKSGCNLGLEVQVGSHLLVGGN